MALPRITPALLKQVRQLWFECVPDGAQAAPAEAYTTWFGQGSPDAKKAFDERCREQCAPVLQSLDPEHFTLLQTLPAPKTYAEERAQDAKIAAPLLNLPTCFPAFRSVTEARETNSPPIASSAEEKAETAFHALGLVLLLDQMPRNVFRQNQAVIFRHFDRISRAVVRTMLLPPPAAAATSSASSGHASWGATEGLASATGFRPDTYEAIVASVVYRPWFGLPFMHSEHLEDHEQCLAIFKDVERRLLTAEGGVHEGALAAIRNNLGFEERHAVIIRRFGRYPHRNTVLGRAMTAEEQEFLDNGGDTFS